MIATELPVTLRQMIDARLDNVERALMLRGMDRGDRKQIVCAIEDQILEMLSQSVGDEPTRDDVLSVLAKLDPPEAYMELSDDDVSSSIPVRRSVGRVRLAAASASGRSGSYNVLAIIGFALTCFTIVLSMSWWILGLFGLVGLLMVAIPAVVCTNVAVWQFTTKGNDQRGQLFAIAANCCVLVASVLTWFTFFFLESM